MKTKEIAEFLSASLVGDPNIEISAVASLQSAEAGQLSFQSRCEPFVTEASGVIVPNNFEAASDAALIKIADPKLAFTRIARILHPVELVRSWHGTAYVPTMSTVNAILIGAYASIGEGSNIGESSQIHAGVRVGLNVKIGSSTIIHPNCVIYDGVTIGSDCVIHAGTVIGSDGFGYVRDESGEHVQFPQLGSVEIGNGVEIGSNCTIDRGSLGTTRIGDGTKIDNLVHVAHNVQIGKRVLIAGQSGIAGSSIIGDDVIIAGQVGISDHVTIMPGAMIGAKSSVFPHKVIRAGFWMGIPVEPIREYRKRIIQARRPQKKD